MFHNESHRKTQDTKTVGEAATQPAVRMPPLREGRHNRLFSAAIALRWNEEDKSLHEGDGIVIQDGGREGSLKHSIKSIIRDMESNGVAKTCIYLGWKTVLKFLTKACGRVWCLHWKLLQMPVYPSPRSRNTFFGVNSRYVLARPGTREPNWHRSNGCRWSFQRNRISVSTIGQSIQVPIEVTPYILLRLQAGLNFGWFPHQNFKVSTLLSFCGKDHWIITPTSPQLSSFQVPTIQHINIATSNSCQSQLRTRPRLGEWLWPRRSCSLGLRVSSKLAQKGNRNHRRARRVF